MLLPRSIRWTPGQISGLQGYGVDRCVVYTDDWAEAWNGVTSVKKKFNRKERRPLYIDGRKIGLFPNQTDPTWEVTSYSYPTLMESQLGFDSQQEFGVYDQEPSRDKRHMTYRSWLSPDEYVVHCIFNIVPYISEISSVTNSPNAKPSELNFSIETEPYSILGGEYKTNHVVIRSGFIEKNVILKQLLEDKLYGSVRNGVRYFPNAGLVEDLINTLFKSQKEYVIIKSEDYENTQSWALLGPDEHLKVDSNGSFVANRIKYDGEGGGYIIEDGRLTDG